MVVEAGAAAVLAGLIFVGLSINLDRLLEYPVVFLRAMAALTMLANVFLVASLVLVPGQSPRLLGLEILLVAGTAWAAVTLLSIRYVRRAAVAYHTDAQVLFVLRQVATVPAIAGGLVLIAERDGLPWLVPAFLATFVVVIAESWVILVEIKR